MAHLFIELKVNKTINAKNWWFRPLSSRYPAQIELYFFNKQQEACTIILHIFLREENRTDEQNNWVIKDL